MSFELERTRRIKIGDKATMKRFESRGSCASCGHGEESLRDAAFPTTDGDLEVYLASEYCRGYDSLPATDSRITWEIVTFFSHAAIQGKD